MKNIVPETPPVADYALPWARTLLIAACILLWLPAYGGLSLASDGVLLGVWQWRNLDGLFVLVWLLYFYSLYRFITRLQSEQLEALWAAWLTLLYLRCNPLLSTAPYSDQLPAGSVSPLCETRLMQWLFQVLDRAIALSKDTSLRSQTNREKLKAGCFDRLTSRLLLRQVMLASLWFVLRGKLFADYVMPLLLALLVMIYAALASWGGSWFY